MRQSRSPFRARRPKTPGWAAAGAVFLVFAACTADSAHREWSGVFANAAGPADWAGDLSPIAESEWSYARAAHLLERAGFGGTPQEIEKLAALTPEEAVDSLVDYEAHDDGHVPVFEEAGIYDEAGMDQLWVDFSVKLRQTRQTGEAYGARRLGDGERRMQPIVDQMYYRIYGDRSEMRRAENWWAERMLLTTRPLEEKMTLFWHNHFATSNWDKVRQYQLMLTQNETLRQHATGSFRSMLIAVSQDPAMLIWLDNRDNVASDTNENYAREILELFSLGVGNYSENDIKEAARALTGWTLEGKEFVIRPQDHDNGIKTIFGTSGNFDGTGLVDLILEQPACADFLTGKIYRYFSRQELSPALAEQLAARLRQADYEIKPFLKTLFLSKDFYSPASYATQIKSPVELLISTYRKLGLTELPGIPRFSTATTNLGQELFHPPNVAGWDGDRAWLSPATLLERGNLAQDLLFPADNFHRYPLRGQGGGGGGGGQTMTMSASNGSDNMMASGGADSMAQGNGDPQPAPRTSSIGRKSVTADYSLGLGVRRGWAKAYERTPEFKRNTAQLSLAAVVVGSGAATAAEAVDCLAERFLRLPLTQGDRHTLIDFLKDRLAKGRIHPEDPDLEKALREVLHLIMSTAEYQLS